jgi:hypothetical protein
VLQPSCLSTYLLYFVVPMASSVFYKFKSQRDESRVSFDGTGISVFDLKKEIILANNLKANDFDLHIYNPNTEQGSYLYHIGNLCFVSCNYYIR